MHVLFVCRAIFSPLPCEYKDERVSAIADSLSDGEHDIILLQKVSAVVFLGFFCKKTVMQF